MERNKNLISILFIITLLIFPMVSAVWYNPFTWFDNENVLMKGEGKWMQDYSTDDDYFLWVENSTKKNTRICLLSKTVETKQKLPDKEITSKENTKVKEKLPKIKATTIKSKDSGLDKDYVGYCYSIKDKENNIKFGKHSTVASFEEEVLEAWDDDKLIGEIILKTENLEYKNGKPNVNLGLGKQIVHAFQINNFVNYTNIFDNVYFKDMETNKIIDRDFDLKYMVYEEVEREITGCLKNTTLNNGTIYCEEYGSIGTYLETVEVWYDLTQEILNYNDEIVVGIEVETKQGDYIDVGFEFAGVDVIVFWSTWTSDLNTGLKLYYTMNGTSGAIIDSTNQNAGTNNGAARGGSGIINASFDFDGNTDDAVSDSNIGITGSSDRTINLWFNQASADAASTDIFSIGTASAGKILTLYISQPTNVYGWLDYNSNGITTEAPSYNSWQMATVTYNGTTLNLYVNGTLMDNGSFTVTLNTDDSPFYIASRLGASAYFDASIDEIGVWNRTLTPTEITQLYNSGSGITYTDSFGPTDTSPQITLTSPTNDTDFTAATRTFQTTVTDSQYVQNVSLKINGAITNTSTSHVNGSYTFYYTTDQGVHNWSILAWNNQSQSNESEVRIFNYTSTPAEITLTSPIANANLTSASVTFVFNVIDNEGVANATLYYNGVANGTDTSGTNGTYNLGRTIEEGYHNWSVKAYDNAGILTESETRFFNYTQTSIVIELLSPTDAYVSPIPLVPVVCRAYNVTDLNLSINGEVVDTAYNPATNQNLTADVEQNFLEGTYTWGCSAKQGEGDWEYSANKTFEVTYSSPVVSLTVPANDTVVTVKSNTFTATVTDSNGVSNVSLYVDGVIEQTNITGGNGTYSFTELIDEGLHNWSIKAVSIYGKSTTPTARTINVSFSAPTISLIYPINNYNSTSSDMNFEFTATDDSGITNISLYLDGVLNETSVLGYNKLISNSFFDGQVPNAYWDFINNLTDENQNSLRIVLNFPNTWKLARVGTSSLSLSTSFSTIIPNCYNETYGTNLIFNSSTINKYICVKDVNNKYYLIKQNDFDNDSTSFSSYGSGIYNITKVISDGNHNWSIDAYSGYGKVGSSETRFFDVHTTAPTIIITEPSGEKGFIALGNDETLIYNISEEGENLTDHLVDCWHTYDTAENTISDNEDLPSEWFDNDLFTKSFSSGGSMNVTRTIDTIILVEYGDDVECPSPIMYYDIDISNCSINNGVKTIDVGGMGASSSSQWFTCDGNLLLNRTYSSFGFCFPVPSQIIVNKTPINCTGNETTFKYIDGKNNITIFAEDYFGLISNNTSTWDYTLLQKSLTFNSTVYEGNSNTFILDITAESGDLTSAIFNYNDINYSTSINYNSGEYLVTATVTSPAVIIDTNHSFLFYLTNGGSTYTTESNNQSVSNADFGVCGGVSNDTILNIFLVDEELQTILFGDIQIGGEIKSLSSGETIATISTNFSNVSNGSICFSPPSAYDFYYMDAEIRYDSTGHSAELYHIQNAEITDGLGNLTLYDLNDNDTTTFDVVYQDDSFIFVEGAVIQLQRKYINEGVYKTVEAPLTSNEGVVVLHIDLDSIKYRATVVKDGVVLDEFDNLVFECQSELTGECSQKLLGTIDSQNDENLDIVRDFSYSEPVMTNNTVTLTFSIPSSSSSNVNVIVEQRDQFGNKSLCNTTIITSAGSISCDFEETIGDSYLTLYVYKDGEAIAMKTYIVHPSSYLDWLGNNYIFIFILLLSLVGMALTSPEWIIINGIVTMVISGGLYLASGLNFVVGLGSIAWLLFAAIILISKIAKQEDR